MTTVSEEQNTGEISKVQQYFDEEHRKHPSFLLNNTGPNNFLVPSEGWARQILGDYDKGLKILEVGAGDGVDSITLAGSTNHVWAIEVSKERLKLAEKNVRSAGKEDRIHSLYMDAHQLGFEDNAFDLVVANSVLLFLDRDRFVRECYRVLKPGGRALFSNESLARHPLLILRRGGPRVRDREKIAKRLTIAEIEGLNGVFDSVNHKEFYLTSVPLAPLVARFGRTTTVRGLSRLFYGVDEFLLQRFPTLRHFCWIGVIEVRKKG